MNSQWITANAGSGKTTALTSRVVRLLLAGVAPENIVCITYTKAAANEMRARVLDMLRALLLDGDAQCAARAEALLGAPPTPAQLAHARALFGRVLDSPTGGVQLTTIHGFCQHLLRRFPMEAGIAPHFTVMDDAAADEALRSAKHALLSGLKSADEWLTGAIDLIGARGGETRFEALAADSISRRRLWDSVWRGQSHASLRAHIYAANDVAVGLTQAALDEALCGMDVAALRGCLPVMLAHKKKTENKYGEGLKRWLEADIMLRQAYIPDLCKLLLTDKGTLRADIAKLDAAEDIGRIANAVLAYQQRCAALAGAEESFAVAVFAKALLDLYSAAKNAAHALDYDDLIAHTLNLCSQPETLGWVMSKLDHRIDHLLIDEAQDNSIAQWELARILVEELIAMSDAARSVLVVGDEKQSIYSFQGAAPEEFARYRAMFVEMLAGSAAPLVKSTLANSYRSAPAVLKLVDDVCAQPAITAAIAATGDCPKHQLKRVDACGQVVVYPPLLAQKDEAEEALAMPTEYALQTHAPQQLAEQIASTIHHWLMVEKRMLVSENRPLTAGDILILVKNRNPLVQPLIRCLQRRGVAVAGLDRLLLADHLAVRDLLALIRWCLNTSDDLALAQVLRSPLLGWSDEQLRTAAHARPATLWQQLEEPWLTHILTLKESAPYDFLTQVLEVSGRRRDFARRFGEEVHEVLDELKAQAAAMPAGMLPTLAQFQDWVAGSTRSIKRKQEAGGADHVRIMTVHGAKGLEAPVVILADTVSVPTTQRERLFMLKTAHGQHLPVIGMSAFAKNSDSLATAKRQKLTQLTDEYYRLLYVAITRAREELHVFGTASAKGVVKEGSWYEVIARSVRSVGVEEEGGLLALRDALPATLKSSKTLATPTIAAPLPAWAIAATAKADNAPVTLNPSGFAGAAAPSRYVAQAGEDAKQRGVRIHRVLELLRADTTQSGIAQLVQYVAPDWSAAQQGKAVAEIAALHSTQRWLWQHAHEAEVSITGSIEYGGQRIAVNGQMDALIRTPDALIILDYKTGRAVPARAADVAESYLLQLKTYRELLRQIYPDMPIRCAILWTHRAQLMWLDEEVDTAQFPQMVTA